MKKLCHLIIVFFTLFSSEAISEELKENTNYRTRTIIEVSDDAINYNKKVGAQSKFVVIDNDNKNNYAIKFLNVYQVWTIKANRTIDDYKNPTSSDVIEDKIYYLNKLDVNGVPIEKKVHQSFGGIVSGPLIVPFKYRLNDDSLSGEATVGYYAGWGWDTCFFGASDTYVTFTPFLSAGLTQVSVKSESVNGEINSDNKSGFSWAAGLLINNWDSVNIGIVCGQDRIGDKNWEHEGEDWLSISIGWEIK